MTVGEARQLFSGTDFSSTGEEAMSDEQYKKLIGFIKTIALEHNALEKRVEELQESVKNLRAQIVPATKKVSA
jgi:hypothetical protein